MVEGKTGRRRRRINLLTVLKNIYCMLRQKAKCKIGVNEQDLTCLEGPAPFNTKKDDLFKVNGHKKDKACARGGRHIGT